MTANSSSLARICWTLTNRGTLLLSPATITPSHRRVQDGSNSTRSCLDLLDPHQRNCINSVAVSHAHLSQSRLLELLSESKLQNAEALYLAFSCMSLHAAASSRRTFGLTYASFGHSCFEIVLIRLSVFRVSFGPLTPRPKGWVKGDCGAGEDIPNFSNFHSHSPVSGASSPTLRFAANRARLHWFPPGLKNVGSCFLLDYMAVGQNSVPKTESCKLKHGLPVVP